MENTLKIFDECYLVEYESENNFCAHEMQTFCELKSALNSSDRNKLEWFAKFGSEIRQILSNVHAHRKGLVYGFDEIIFGQYGWLERPVFLDQEETEFGRLVKTRWGNHSTITVGRGLNDVWCNGLSISWGMAGSSSGLSVYNQAFPSKQAAFKAALTVLRERMEEKVGNGDTMNYNQKTIRATFKDIEKYRIAEVQLSFF